MSDAISLSAKFRERVDSRGLILGDYRVHACVPLDSSVIAIIYSPPGDCEVFGLLSDLSRFSEMFSPDPDEALADELVAAVISTFSSTKVLTEYWARALEGNLGVVNWRIDTAFQTVEASRPPWWV